MSFVTAGRHESFIRHDQAREQKNARGHQNADENESGAEAPPVSENPQKRREETAADQVGDENG